MAVKLFASILIGSTETELKIYELSPRREIRCVDCVSRRIDLGVDAYACGTLSTEKVNLLTETLREYRQIMEGYHVSAHRCVATSALREIRTALITKDYLEKQTGLTMTILSNSEQRLLDYKSIASRSASFEKIIQNGTMIVDIGGSSLQISVFDKDKLFTTQNIRVGKITAREKFYPLARNNEHFEALLAELMDHELAGFGKLYQKDRQIVTLIATNRELQQLFSSHVQRKGSDVITTAEFMETYRRIVYLNPDEIMSQYSVSSDSAKFIVPSAIICRCLLERFGAEKIWLPEVSIGDGVCYEYAISSKLLRARHSFDEDIIAASRNIAKRYKSSNAHIKNVEELSLTMFDRLKKVHGLGQRERLLLQISAILHNCGKYISLADVADCAYNIIMATEIIGLSHAERQIVANVVKFNTTDFVYYEELALTSSVTREEYLVIAKLTAILRAANSLDRGHRQKIKEVDVTVQGGEVLLGVRTNEDLTLEKGALEDKDALFEEVFNLHPVIRQKKSL